MRPVYRGDSPQPEDFEDYRDAFPYLQSRIGPYCSYCERRIATQLAVEHIQPKDDDLYPELIGRWDNYLLGCVNCNSTKGDKDVHLDEIFLPDRDNTMAAFDYTPDGKVVPMAGLSGHLLRIAKDTLSLTGLDKRIDEAIDENGELVAIDRVAQRMEAWLKAQSSKDDLAASNTPRTRQMIVKFAAETGFFSIWMKVFRDDPAMRRIFIEGFETDITTDAGTQRMFFGFPGTARDCFNADTTLRSPRPANGLANCGKL